MHVRKSLSCGFRSLSSLSANALNTLGEYVATIDNKSDNPRKIAIVSRVIGLPESKIRPITIRTNSLIKDIF